MTGKSPKTVIVRDHNYSPLQRKIIDFAREAVIKCPDGNKSLHCAILVYRGLIISHGINKESLNHDFAIGYQWRSIHAEWDCLRKFRKMNPLDKLSSMDLYSIRITRQGKIKNAKPCKRCHTVIQNNQPRKVFYTTDNGEIMTLNGV